MRQKGYSYLAIAEGYEDKFEAALAQLEARLATSDHQEEEDEQSDLLQVHSGVGVVEIKGMLTDRNSWINSWFGLVAYDEIRRATLRAVEAGVGGIMYLVDSPGGKVSGMNGAAELISSLEIPTLTYTESTMASAALFLGIQSDHVLAGDFAEVGSVGVVATVMDYSEALKKDGIKAKRFRSGDLKQAGHPYFKMTDKEDRYMQEQVMLYAEKFYNIVSEGRGIPRPLLESLDITSGRTFIGGQAQSVGLIDGITNFDAAFVKIAGLAQKNIDSRNTNPVTYGKF